MGSRHNLKFISMMDDDGNVTDVGDFQPDYKRYIVSSFNTIKIIKRKFHDFLTLLTSTEKLLTRAGFELAPREHQRNLLCFNSISGSSWSFSEDNSEMLSKSLKCFFPEEKRLFRRRPNVHVIWRQAQECSVACERIQRNKQIQLNKMLFLNGV